MGKVCMCRIRHTFLLLAVCFIFYPFISLQAMQGAIVFDASVVPGDTVKIFSSVGRVKMTYQINSNSLVEVIRNWDQQSPFDTAFSLSMGDCVHIFWGNTNRSVSFLNEFSAAWFVAMSILQSRGNLYTGSSLLKGNQDIQGQSTYREGDTDESGYEDEHVLVGEETVGEKNETNKRRRLSCDFDREEEQKDTFTSDSDSASEDDGKTVDKSKPPKKEECFL